MSKKKSKKFKKRATFKMGDVVAFAPENFNPGWWDNLPIADRVKYYGPLGYGETKLKTFVFITEIRQTPGHCVLVAMDDGHIEVMRHTANFRKVDEDEL